MIRVNRYQSFADNSTAYSYNKHIIAWAACDKCPLQHTRKQVVLFRGHLPADVLFIGEAPGESENILGYPFVGPAGNLIDQIIWQSIAALTKNQAMEIGPGYSGYGDTPYGDTSIVTWAFTNIVACIPQGESTIANKRHETEHTQNTSEGSGQPRIPNKMEAKACSPRLQEFINICQPRHIVCLGQSAKTHLPKTVYTRTDKPMVTSKVPVTYMIHPAAILRASLKGNPNESKQGLEVKRCVLTLTKVFQSILTL